MRPTKITYILSMLNPDPASQPPSRHRGLKCRYESRTNLHILHLKGELRVHTVKEFRESMEEILKTGGRNVALHLMAVTYVDSAGIGTLVNYHMRLHKAGGGLHLVAVPHTIRSVFNETRLFDILPNHETLVAVAQQIGS